MGLTFGVVLEAQPMRPRRVLDDQREEAVDPEEEEAEQAGHDQHHDAGGDRLLAGRPGDLAGLGPDLPEEFAGIDSGHDRLFVLVVAFGQPPGTGGSGRPSFAMRARLAR